ncbi:putative transposase [Streptococcus pneumoniae GA44452]|nr:putative transposase [Streptococcus pneumoniae GA44452]
MDSGFATPKLYDLIEKTGQYYLIKLKKNTVLSRLGDLSLPCPQDEDLTILPHSAYSETLYQAGSWSHKRRVCQFSERKEGNLFYDVISLVNKYDEWNKPRPVSALSWTWSSREFHQGDEGGIFWR